PYGVSLDCARLRHSCTLLANPGEFGLDPRLIYSGVTRYLYAVLVRPPGVFEGTAYFTLERALFFQFPYDAIVDQIFGLERAKLLVRQYEHANAVADSLHRRIDPF